MLLSANPCQAHISDGAIEILTRTIVQRLLKDVLRRSP